MAEADNANQAAAEEKRPEESSLESGTPGSTISRVKLLDTMVDTFLQKLVAAGRYGGGRRGRMAVKRARPIGF
jgi:polyamine-modulated factor 1